MEAVQVKSVFVQPLPLTSFLPVVVQLSEVGAYSSVLEYIEEA
jgi:hypothetical protein